MRIAFKRLVPGRRSGRRCRAPSRRLAHARRCTRALGAGTLTLTAPAGLNSVAFRGRVGTRTLKPGRYRAVFIAIDAAGASAPKTLSFRIVRR